MYNRHNRIFTFAGMVLKKDLSEFIHQGSREFIPQLSIDCVIFGYHENSLKVLLLCWKEVEGWVLPGGYIGRSESIDEAARRILHERTGLTEVFLSQFHTFGDLSRSKTFDDPRLKSFPLYKHIRGSWLDNRTISIGYYALIDFSMASPTPDEFSSDCTWWDFHALPDILFDHVRMIELALKTLRAQIKYQPIGLNLLQSQFTLPELQILYETILGKQLDRRNFQKKILHLGILKKHDETRRIGPHRSPNLYSFDRDNYDLALSKGNGLDF